jgi:hypothetical protein
MLSSEAKRFFTQPEVLSLLDEFETRYQVTSSKNMKAERTALLELMWDKLTACNGGFAPPITQDATFKVC